jgi:hypothetical protein
MYQRRGAKKFKGTHHGSPLTFLLPCADEDVCELVLSETKEVLPVASFFYGGLMNNWWVYIVEKKMGLYVGITTDLENRMRQHGQPTPLY